MVKRQSMSEAPVCYKAQLPKGQYTCCISFRPATLGSVYRSSPLDLKFSALFDSEIKTATVLSLYSLFYKSVKSQVLVIPQLRLII